MEERSFSGDELAGLARVAPELIGRLAELGILGAPPYGLGDVRRVRLVDACQLNVAAPMLPVALSDAGADGGVPWATSGRRRNVATEGTPAVFTRNSM